MKKLFSVEQINESLAQLGGGWSAGEKKLFNEFKFKNYGECLVFINKVGELCEQQNHHADICFGYNYCKISISTHYLGGITELDFALAKSISGL